MDKPHQNLPDFKTSLDPNIVHIETELNEFYAQTHVTQYYINKSNRIIELILKFPSNPKIQFSKFVLELNGKKIVSKILEKEKAEEKYSDAIASGNSGIISSKTDKYIKVNIGNINPNDIVKLTTEFIQFITSEDMSYCYETMSSYPIINGKNCNLKGVKEKIVLNTHSKLTRLITLGLAKNVDKIFNESKNQCIISFNLKKKKAYDCIKILFRTESMNNLNCISQYDPVNNETSCILSMLYSKNKIPISTSNEIDTNENYNYYEMYQKNLINNNPSLFIFIIDQSGSMSGKPIELVREMLNFFMKSLPKNSFFQIIGFGSNIKFINKKPLIYTEENVNKTIEKIENLEADLGGTNLFFPLKAIFREDNYKDINLGRNVFILTDGETSDDQRCLNIIAKNNDKFRVHSFGIGSYYDKKFIKKCGKLGKGSYNFVNDVSNISSVVIQALNKSLRSYLYDVKFTLKNINYEYVYSPINNICYQDEIINYYFIAKDKLNENELKLDFECYDKGKFMKKECIFKNNHILKDKEGDIISKIIIGNILNDKNAKNNITKENNIKLSIKYNVVSEFTSLFGKIESDKATIDEKGLKVIEQNYIDDRSNDNINIGKKGEKVSDNESESESDSDSFRPKRKAKKKALKRRGKKHYCQKMDSESGSDSDSSDVNKNCQQSKKKNFEDKKSEALLPKMDSESGSDSDSSDVKEKCQQSKKKDSGSDSEESEERKNKKRSIKCKKNKIQNDSEESEERKSKKENIKYLKNENDSDEEEDSEDKEKKRKCMKFCEEKLKEECYYKVKEERKICKDKKCKKKMKKSKKKMKEDSESESESENEKECKKAKMKDKTYRKKESEDDSMFEIKKIAFTQNVIDGYWSLNKQTKLLIKSKKDLYEQIENILKEKNFLYEENIIITILVLFTLRTNKNINLLEYTIIINKGLEYLSNLNINYEEIETKLK